MARWRRGLLDRKIQTFDPDEVTSREGGQPEVDPLAAGLKPEDTEAIWDAVVSLYRTGLHPAIALCLRRGGKVVLDRAIGHSDGNAPGADPDTQKVPATPQTLFNIFSASKAVTAMLIHMLDERGLVSVDEPVSAYLPEFARHGKDWITLRHVLTHRAGIPRIPKDRISLDLLADWDAIIEMLCDATPSHRAGRTLAYHALTGGWVLGEVLQRVTGQPLRDFMRENVLDPLGLTHMNFGVDAADIPNVAMHALTGPPLLFPVSALLERALGVPFDQAIEFSNDPRFLTGVVPAGNVIGTANEVCRFFEMLLRGGELDGARIFKESTIRRATSEQTFREVDVTFGIPLRYSMGFILGDAWVSIYGPNTAQAFGHLGFTTVTAFADPERDLSACLMSTGKHFLTPKIWQHLQVLRTITGRCPAFVE